MLSLDPTSYASPTPSTASAASSSSTHRHTAQPPASQSQMSVNAMPGDASPSSNHRRHIWIITGPAGCGKTTVATHLAQSLSLPYIEGDEYHPVANIQKMASGIPLTDADRWDWLIALRQQSLAALSDGAPGVVLTCSALKRKYRDVIRIASYNDHNVLVHFVYLAASEELLLSRVKARQGHYMKDAMVHSQFTSLEAPSKDETDCLIVDVGATMPQVQALALRVVKDALEAIVRDVTEDDSP